MKKVSLKLSGLSCGGCVAAVKSAIERAGGKEVKVSLERAEFLSEGENIEKYIEAVKSSGYNAEPE
jgi:copper chaperone CopZ